MPRTYDERKHNRYHKAMRRLREDRAQHGEDHSCPCFDPDGRTFSDFADNPALCSACCGNRRKWEGPTRQELRGPTVEEWRDVVGQIL